MSDLCPVPPASFACTNPVHDVMIIHPASLIGVGGYRVIPYSACARCMSEFNGGSRAQANLCPGYRESAPGGQVCWNCSHSWKDHI
jgi:hypothetical protein